MAIIIVGDYDAAYLESTLSEHFPIRQSQEKNQKNITSEAFKRPWYNLSEPEKGSIIPLVLTDSELSRSRVDLYWKRKAEPRRADLAYYRQGVIDFLASAMINLRFDEEAAKSETPYVYAGAGSANYGFSSRFYILTAQAKTGAVNDTLTELLLAKESLSRYGFIQDEADRAKASLISYLEKLVSENQPSDYYVNSFTQNFLKGETVPDLDWELEAINELLPGISIKEINQTVKGYFADDDLTVIISAPEAEKSSLPDNSGIKSIAAETRKARISPPSSTKPQGELMSYIPESGSIVSEKIDSETGAIRMALSNGAELIFKETSNKNSEISLYAQARGGTLSAPDNIAVSASLAAEMLNASGLGSFSRPELTKILIDKQVSLSFWTQNFLRGFQGSASLKDAKVLFEMLYLSFTQPRIDSDAVRTLLDQRRSNMAFQENDPNIVFRREIARTISGNPRFYPLESTDLEKADIDDALAFARACLNPADFTFVIAGNIDLILFRTLAETYLASIPPAPAFNEWADIDPERPSDTEKEILRGREERSTVYMAWFSPQTYSEEKSAIVSVLNEYLDIRLTEEIRETLGGVYSVSSWASISPIPRGELSGGVSFFCDPKRAEELISAVKGEFFKIAAGNIDQSVLEKSVEALIKGQETSVQSNLYIAQSYANSAVIFQSPLSRLDKRPALFRAVNQLDIQQAAAELTSGTLFRLILYPEGSH